MIEETLKFDEVVHITLKDENGKVKDERIITNGQEEIIKTNQE